MGTSRQRISLLASLVLISAVYASGTQEAVINNTAEVLKYQEMAYPPLAQYLPYQSEGVVIVQVVLDEQGVVKGARALSGNLILVAETLANVSTWRFRANERKTAIIVYNFRHPRGECLAPSSLFTFQPPNFVTVLGCFPKPHNTVRVEPASNNETISDRDMRVTDPDTSLKYPVLARQVHIEGLVVLQLKL